ncbi:cation:proton antiporter [Neorhizobium alkalisoli]|uniref:Sodium/proton antiporter (CPA1 family) n=1 Tax=Neorhizobium alkalisoli TaxID=528178 RepID=A0A561Q0V2_9HYPH|nr:cation:proton antiporter [Neorhizobium alkalisoli]TWF43983.1 sodium/proton antiporter (CPA1 family) [Neorhizobium alkalisoli]
MNSYVITLFIFGVVVLLTAWLPMALRRLPLSLPICCVGIGMLLAWSPFTPLPHMNPLQNGGIAEHLTEFVVIVALMGAGLKIDRPLGLRQWATTWRLLGIAMPISIGIIALLGWSLLGLGAASALLLGAALAPTDPVLASDIQVGPPQTGEEDDIRFALTSEAGLNDGLSFPFVLAAIAIANKGNDISGWIGHWFFVDVAWKLVAGVGMGWIVGQILGYLTFKVPQVGRIARTGDGLAALGFTCIAYGATELVHGYGFVAVFVTALTLRSVERESAYHGQLHDFGEQIERLLTMVLLVCFGSVLAEGTLLAHADWRIIAVAIIVLAIIRPLAAWTSLIGCPRPQAEKIIVSVFGIRGIGSIYYLAYASTRATFESAEVVWSTVFIIILMSIILHGIAVTPVMRWIDRERDVDATRPRVAARR